MTGPAERKRLNAQFLDDPSINDNTSLDDSKRIKWQSGRNPFRHFFEKRSLNKQLELDLQNLFKDRYRFSDLKSFSKIWSKIGAKVWNKKMTLTVGKLREIDEQFKTKLVYHGPGITRIKVASENISDIESRVSEVVNVLLHGGKITSNLRDKDIIKAVLVKHDPVLMDAFAKEIQAEFNHLLEKPPKSEKEAIVWRAFHGNLVSLLPYVYLSHGSSIMIPHLNSELTCQKVDYDLEVIDLPFDEKTTPMNVLGLTPKNGTSDAPTYLSFLGTTFPAASGFAATVLSDFTPGSSVGEAVFERNKEKIESWMLGKQNIHAVGMSLGGAMCFHLLKNFSDKISQVDAFVPAGLYSTNWNEPLSLNCKVNIYCQSGDIVSLLGSFPTGENISLYEVYSHQNVFNENLINSHVRAFTGCKEVSVIKMDPKEVNKSFCRNFLTKMHKYLGPVLFYFPTSVSLFFYRLGAKISGAVAEIFTSKPKNS